MSEQQDLELLIHGHTLILQIKTHEEKRALNLIIQIATRNVIPVFKWTITEGSIGCINTLSNPSQTYLPQ
jgi:hypothetical protein